MTLRYLTITLFSILLIAGCSDSSTDADTGADGLGLRAVNTGNGDLEIEMDGEIDTVFCYDDGCTAVSGFSFYTIYEGKSSITSTSQVDKRAVGVKVGFRVTKGQGKMEVVRGESYRDEGGFKEFEPGNVIHTSDTFSEGDVVTYTVGETD